MSPAIEFILHPGLAWFFICVDAIREFFYDQACFLGYMQRPGISFFEYIICYPYPGPIKGYYILSLSRQKKDMCIYILYPFVPKVIKYICKTPALSQFLINEKPDLLKKNNWSNFEGRPWIFFYCYSLRFVWWELQILRRGVRVAGSYNSI
jgi:hypothetical protein